MSVIIDQISVEMINEQEKVSLEKIIKTETQGCFSSDEHLLLWQSTWVRIPAPTWRLTTSFNSRSRESKILFCPQQTLHKGGAHTYLLIKHTQKNKNQSTWKIKTGKAEKAQV